MSLTPALASNRINVIIAEISINVRYIKRKVLKRRYQKRYRSCLQVDFSLGYAQYSRATGPNARILVKIKITCKISGFLFVSRLLVKIGRPEKFYAEPLRGAFRVKYLGRSKIRPGSRDKSAPVILQTVLQRTVGLDSKLFTNK